MVAGVARWVVRKIGVSTGTQVLVADDIKRAKSVQVVADGFQVIVLYEIAITHDVNRGFAQLISRNPPRVHAFVPSDDIAITENSNGVSAGMMNVIILNQAAI